MDQIIVALMLGFSFGNLWLCAILVFSLQTTNRYTCLGYLAGRAATIILLSFALSLLGMVTTFSRAYINLASGILLITFAAYLAATQLAGWIPPWRRRGGVGDPGSPSCNGECSGCPTREHHEYQSACSSCHDHGACSAEEPEVAPLTEEARKIWGKTEQFSPSRGFFVGALLGVFRGAAMCTKLIVLVPIIFNASPLKSLAIGGAFALSSSVYPLLGFFLGKFALKLVRHKRSLFILSCLFLAGSGIYYLTAAFRHL
ncbi:hypothetical protein KKF84_12535 [Myxococcota bacterium]|nr:hypothetical protein [Myxococcota bacterium]